MFRSIANYLQRKEQEWRKSFDHDITDPAGRRRAERHFRWFDHHILRTYWHNFEEFAPGAFRSNQPDHKRFEDYAAKGIKTVLNLRGALDEPHYLFEVESCKALGLSLVSAKMAARRAPKRAELVALLDAFETIERPFLIHCKSGADRTGLAAAIYIMLYEGASIAEARRQLSFRYIHVRKSATGVLDHLLDLYAARVAEGPIAIDAWIKTEYRQKTLAESYENKKRQERFWQGWR